MTTLDARVVRAALEAKGMTASRSHHIMLEKRYEGGPHLHTRLSQGVKQLDDYLIGLLAKQCALRKPDFVRLIECSLTADGWDAKVREVCTDGSNPYTSRS